MLSIINLLSIVISPYGAVWCYYKNIRFFLSIFPFRSHIYVISVQFRQFVARNLLTVYFCFLFFVVFLSVFMLPLPQLTVVTSSRSLLWVYRLNLQCLRDFFLFLFLTRTISYKANCPGVFFPLMKFPMQILILRGSLVLLRNSFLIFTLSFLVWWCSLPIFPNTSTFPSFQVSFGILYLVVLLLPLIFFSLFSFVRHIFQCLIPFLYHGCKFLWFASEYSFLFHFFTNTFMSSIFVCSLTSSCNL